MFQIRTCADAHVTQPGNPDCRPHTFEGILLLASLAEPNANLESDSCMSLMQGAASICMRQHSNPVLRVQILYTQAKGLHSPVQLDRAGGCAPLPAHHSHSGHAAAAGHRQVACRTAATLV